MPDDELQNLWRKQDVENMQISIEDIRRKATAFQKTTGARNAREYAAAAVAIAAYSWFFIESTETIPRIAFALIVAAAVLVVYNIRTRGAARRLPGEMGLSTCIDFHRGELERQRKLNESVWSWYLGPFIPGMALLLSYGVATAPAGKRGFPVAFLCFAALFFVGIGWLNKRVARDLGRQIEDLDATAGVRSSPPAPGM